jgi:hypothetical protein
VRLKFNVSGDRIKILNSRELYSGNANYRCNFLLSSEWEGLEVFAVFTKENISYEKRIEDGVCVIPFEILKDTGVFSVGIFGTNGEAELLRISSNVIYLDVEEGAFREAEYSEEATPTIWEQYVMLCADKVSQAESARDEAQLAKEQAEAASEGIEVYAQEAKDAKEGALAAAETATKEKNEVINLKADCENAKDGAEKFKGDAEAAKIEAEGYKISAKAASTESEEYKTIAGEFAADADTHKQEAEAAAERAEAAAESINPENFVSKNANEEISGNKTFSGDVMLNRIGAIMPEGGDGSGYIELGAGTIGEAYAALGIGTGAKIEAYLDYNNMWDDPEHYGNRLALSGKVLINGKEAATKEDIENITTPTIDESNLVHKNGFEEINGFKMFHDGIDTPRISYDGDLVLHNSFVELKLTTDYKVVINDKEVAVKEDITTAIRSAILDSWAEVIEP